VIRVGLRPLERMGRVASEIANGDLSRRVTPDDPRTEVGRLGASLNQMLVQIEQAFADRGESEDRLRRFLSDASHELRTPLASIRGYAELFRLGAAAEPEELERAMARIESEATRMGVLVENLLLLARLDELPEMTLVPVDLRELAEHAVQDTRAVAPDRDVRLTADGAAWVLADSEQLRQLLTNLTRNAVIHTPTGTAIEVTVGADGGRAVLEVRDHGPGLPADAGDHVFERFWRTEGGRSRGRGGAGLGLAIVKAIVQAHHGEVHAGNATDGGAVFTVTLPIVQAANRAGLPEEPATRA
jgi:two-component system, OmpR family, sensor kinase